MYQSAIFGVTEHDLPIKVTVRRHEATLPGDEATVHVAISTASGLHALSLFMPPEVARELGYALLERTAEAVPA